MIKILKEIKENKRATIVITIIFVLLNLIYYGVILGLYAFACYCFGFDVNFKLPLFFSTILTIYSLFFMKY